jgi:RNA polymerase sigma factor (sigma-70 family)
MSGRAASSRAFCAVRLLAEASQAGHDALPRGCPFGNVCRGSEVITGVTDVAKADSADDDVKIEDLFADSRQSLVRLAYLIVGSAAVAEEIVQEAFVQLLRRRELVQVPAAYLRVCVARLAVKWKKRSAAERDRFERIGEPAAVGMAEIDTTWEALEKLRPERRAVVVLRFYEDLPHAAIATILGIREATVRTRLHRALSDLRKELAE